jgi:flagellin
MISLNATGATSAVSYYLGQNNRNLQKSLSRLSSGYRINSAVDDPGGLAVSMKLSASLRRTDAVSANVGNALSFLQSQDGVLEVASSTVLRMSELATLATTESVSTNDTALYNTEFVELKADITSLLDEEFNGISLFAAGDQTLSVVLSENGNSASISKANLNDVNTLIAALTISTVSFATTASAALKTAIQSIASLRASNGAEQSRLAYAQDILAVNRVNLEAASSRIMDTDIAGESTNFARLNIIQEAGLAILAQANTSA